jgi:hypothetical protein
MRTRDMMPRVTDVEPWANAVAYTIGFRRYIANRELEVVEVEGDKCFASEHATWQQAILRGGKRDEDGRMWVATKDLHRTGNIFS